MGCRKNHALGFWTGLVCGVGIALLLAPRSGREARTSIANETREKTGRIRQQAAVLRDTANQAFRKGRREFQRQKENLKRVGEDGVRAFQGRGA